MLCNRLNSGQRELRRGAGESEVLLKWDLRQDGQFREGEAHEPAVRGAKTFSLVACSFREEDL